jgi:glycosyltransferase involved in cell wall biosynthesis
MTADDELVIVDDASMDSTLKLLEALRDPRVRLFPGAVNVGHVRAFEAAMQEARGQFVALSDQDDVWPTGRLDAMQLHLASADLVVCAFDTYRANTGPSTVATVPSTGLRRLQVYADVLLARRSYFGSTMALRRNVLPLLLPIPTRTEAHDLWIALAVASAGTVVVTDMVSTHRRIHAHNLTPRRRRAMRKVLKSRVLYVRLITIACARAVRLRRA